MSSPFEAGLGVKTEDTNATLRIMYILRRKKLTKNQKHRPILPLIQDLLVTQFLFIYIQLVYYKIIKCT